MKAIKIIRSFWTVCLMGVICMACDDANEFSDTNTNNPSWVENYTDTLAISHPESIANTQWVRGIGLKTNAYGEEIQGFVESVNFVSADSVSVKMSKGSLPASFPSAIWVDESNTEAIPYYEYTYSKETGKVEILKRVVDDKGKVSKSAIFTGIAIIGEKTIMTIVHFCDTPVQSYLVKQ